MIFTTISLAQSPSKGHYHQCVLEDGKCLAVFSGYVGLYKSVDSINDALGNGLLCLLSLPDSMQPKWNGESGFVDSVLGGCLILNSTAIVLVKPNTLELYSNGQDALHGRNCLEQVAIPMHRDS